MPTKLITSQNAREMAQKSHEAKKARLAELRLAVDDAYQVTDFAGEQLAHTRAEIRSLRDLMAGTRDAKEKQAFAMAITKMGEWEQRLDMRPGPGNLKPSNTPPPKPSMPDPVD